MIHGDINKKTFNKAWASFVDISTGLEAVTVDYVIMAGKNLTNERVQRWIRTHKLMSGWCDACCMNYTRPNGLLARAPTMMAHDL